MRKNFIDLINISKNKKIRDADDFLKVGVLAQEIEFQLLAGNLYVFPNMRSLYEITVFYTNRLWLKVEVDEGEGRGPEDCYALLHEKERNKEITKYFYIEKNPLRVNRENTYSPKFRIEALNLFLAENGVDTSTWRLQEMRKRLNVFSHGLSIPIDSETRSIRGLFEDCFDILKCFHDTIYSEIVCTVTGEVLDEYDMPEEEVLIAVEKYLQRCDDMGIRSLVEGNRF